MSATSRASIDPIPVAVADEIGGGALESARTALAELSARLALADEAFQGVVYRWDIANDAFEFLLGPRSLLGYEASEVQHSGRWWKGRMHPEDAPRMAVALRAAEASNARTMNVEYRLLTRDGHYAWVADRARLERRDDGRVGVLLGTVVSVQDIALREAIEERLRQSEARLHATFENAPLGIAETSPEGVLLRVNEGFCTIVGYTRAELEGGLFQSITHRDDLPANLEFFGRLLTGEIPHYEMEKRYVRRDGKIVWAHLFGSLVRDREGMPAYGVSVIQDISRRKQAEAEREALLRREQAARREAEEASRLKDEFLATVSHELRTPLNAIVGWTAIGRTRDFDPVVVARAFDTIERNARAQKQLIEDLLDVSRIVAGKLRLEMARVDLKAVIEAAMESTRTAADAKGIAMKSRFAADLPPVRGDFTRLLQVVWNLLSNAAKFTPRGGRIDIHVARAEEMIEITVSDTGQGINADFVPFVFDRFRQEDGSITRRHGGLGLGLAIVRHLTELHGGNVRVHSAGEGCGATFVVQLPCSTSAAEAGIDAQSSALVPPVLNGLRLLVVEDEEDSLFMLDDLLRVLGAIPALTRSGSEALALLEQSSFDLLLADIGMPGMDGYALIRELRRREALGARRTPAVALTAYGRPEDRLRALDAGFQNHVTKPVEPGELALVIERTASSAPRS
jgi:PAS domain S-box-containing protein